MKKKTIIAVLKYLALIPIAVIGALINEIFVFGNSFAPSGINGLSTMIQYLFNFSVGYMYLIINIPMIIVAYFIVSKEFAIKNLIYIVVFSGVTLFLKNIDVSKITYIAPDQGGALMASISAGFFAGLLYALAVKLGGSTGGTDIIGEFIHIKHPIFDSVWIIFALNALIVVASFFVYGYNYTAVILCIIYCFVSSRVADGFFKGIKSAVKFEVITTHPDKISRELITTLHHGVTIVPAKGVYTNTDKSILICVVNRRQTVDFEKIISQYDDTFAIVSTANTTIGRFTRSK